TETDVRSRLQLSAHVHVGCRIVSDQDDPQTRRASLLRGERGDLRPDLVLNTPRQRLAVKEASTHTSTPLSSDLTLSVRPSTTNSSPAAIPASGDGLNSMVPPARLMPTTITPKF